MEQMCRCQASESLSRKKLEHLAEPKPLIICLPKTRNFDPVFWHPKQRTQVQGE